MDADCTMLQDIRKSNTDLFTELGDPECTAYRILTLKRAKDVCNIQMNLRLGKDALK